MRFQKDWKNKEKMFKIFYWRNLAIILSSGWFMQKSASFDSFKFWLNILDKFQKVSNFSKKNLIISRAFQYSTHFQSSKTPSLPLSKKPPISILVMTSHQKKCGRYRVFFMLMRMSRRENKHEGINLVFCFHYYHPNWSPTSSCFGIASCEPRLVPLFQLLNVV